MCPILNTGIRPKEYKKFTKWGSRHPVWGSYPNPPEGEPLTVRPRKLVILLWYVCRTCLMCIISYSNFGTAWRLYVVSQQTHRRDDGLFPLEQSVRSEDIVPPAHLKLRTEQFISQQAHQFDEESFPSEWWAHNVIVPPVPLKVKTASKLTNVMRHHFLQNGELITSLFLQFLWKQRQKASSPIWWRIISFRMVSSWRHCSSSSFESNDSALVLSPSSPTWQGIISFRMASSWCHCSSSSFESKDSARSLSESSPMWWGIISFRMVSSWRHCSSSFFQSKDSKHAHQFDDASFPSELWAHDVIVPPVPLKVTTVHLFYHQAHQFDKA
jgi:hypothetical protein